MYYIGGLNAVFAQLPSAGVTSADEVEVITDERDSGVDGSEDGSSAVSPSTVHFSIVVSLALCLATGALMPPM